jgi:hypothetical protein
MKAWIGIAAFVVATLLSFAVCWKIDNYRDSRHVGHTKTYCVLDMGSN